MGKGNNAYAMLDSYGRQNNNKGWRFLTYWSGYTKKESPDAPGGDLDWGGKGGTCYLIRQNKVPTPGQIILLGDSVSSGPFPGFYNHRDGDHFNTSGTFRPDGNSDWETRLWFHHPERKADLLFFDGSVRAMSPFDANESELNIRNVFDADGSALDFAN